MPREQSRRDRTFRLAVRLRRLGRDHRRLRGAKLGYFADLCLNVDFVYVPFTESAASLVSAGTAQITGEGSAADAIVQEAEGSNFVADLYLRGHVGLCPADRGQSITKLTQLEGKVLGYHPMFPVVLREMLVKAGVDLSKVHIVVDPSYNPLLLVHGTFAAIQAYQSNEPITLRAAHEPFNMWTPAQFGIPGTFNVQVVNRKFLASHPTATADFLRAEFLGVQLLRPQPGACVDFLAKAQGPTFDVAHGEAEWRVESTLALDHHLAGKGIGVQTAARMGPGGRGRRPVQAARQGRGPGRGRGHNDRGVAVPWHAAHLALAPGHSASLGRLVRARDVTVSRRGQHGLARGPSERLTSRASWRATSPKGQLGRCG